ncbi:MAG: shikimate dehydrogenase [Lachnospiraceae bacterium]|nr:shikimate dehydrogenase [Lachnospiraceae bacterium]
MTERYAVVGERLPHTLSPEIHNFIFEKLGLQERYGICEVPLSETDGLLDRLAAAGMKGINVTIPYKETLMPQLDVIAPEAQRIGAVNTIHFAEGKTYGYNTDYYGFLMMMERAGIEIKGKDACVFGAGGAAKAVIAALTDAGASSVTVLSRNASRFPELKEHFPHILTGLLSYDAFICGDIAVNTTPLGMYPNNLGLMPIERACLSRFSCAADIVYNPVRTLFLKAAEELGLTCAGGLYMLIYQAIKAEEIFQNINIDNKTADELYELLIKKF